MMCPTCGASCVPSGGYVGAGGTPVGPWGCPNCFWCEDDPDTKHPMWPAPEPVKAIRNITDTVD